MPQPATHPLLSTRRAGVLMHITSLPSPFGAGDIGPAAYQFVDWLADAGISVWQMLPIGPVGFGDSPYSSPSSFAIEPTLLSLDILVEQGLLEKSDLKVPAKGVALVGDVPIFVTADSADVRAHPELFRLKADGTPEVLTGVPPDGFSADGQLWGHPHYAWDAHIKQKFSWWTSRITCASERFDLVRIDHFIGFTRAYEVAAGAKNARKGVWRPAPGRALLTAMAKSFPSLPLIAEDLGAVTPEVEALRDDFGLAGMRIVQNAFWSGKSGDMPHNHPFRAVVFSGTHDNETAAQWWQGRDAAQKARFKAYAGEGAVHEAMARIVMASPAALAVLPMQDILGLGKAGRMNLPGTATGNWAWRMEPGAANTALATKIRALVDATGRG